MDNLNKIVIGAAIFLLGQTIAWGQVNLQFVWKWAKDHPFWMALLLGFPIGYSYIYATKFITEGFDGNIWPARLIGFAMGIISFAFLTYLLLNENITLKTIITLVLATAIVLIQVLWK